MAPSRRSALLLLLLALAFFGIGLCFLLWPQTMGRFVGIQLGSATAISDLRAVYGGLQLAIAGYLGFCARDLRLHRGGFLLALFAFAGLAGARALSFALLFPRDAINFVLWAMELLGLLTAVFGLRSLEPREEDGP